MGKASILRISIGILCTVGAGSAYASACDQQAKCFSVCEEFTTVGSPECKSACSPAVAICEAERKRTSSGPKPMLGNSAGTTGQARQAPTIPSPAAGAPSNAVSDQPCVLVQYAPTGFMTYCPDPKKKFGRLNDVNEPCFLSNIVGFTGDTITFCTVGYFPTILRGTPFQSSGYYKRVVKRGPQPASY